MLNTVTKLSKRVKQMGLVLGDLFRMADAKYDGQITKGMFMKVISGLKSDLDDNLINEMFYAIDTNTNNVLD
jgi:Ca2+-binding EF-hand superfamily protein